MYSSMPRTARNHSVVDHGDIMKAVKIYGQQSTDKNIVELPRISGRVTKINILDNGESRIDMKNSEFIPEIRVQALTPPIKTAIRTEHDLNDEGFEESVSLMSAESLSAEASSGNFESEKSIPPKTITRADSSESNDTNSSSGLPATPNLRKTNSLRTSTKPIVAIKTSETPKRTSSFRTPMVMQRPLVMKRTPSSSLARPLVKSSSISSRPGLTRTESEPKSVERSSSKSSLRSSRSSLNSINSASTVKKIPGISTYTKAINDLTTDLKAKKPLSALQPYNSNNSRNPIASRSNSGSIAIAVNKPKPKTFQSNSFKENQSRGTNFSTTASSKTLGFMRPTASSTAKDLVDGVKPKPLVKKTFK
ncbi:nuclear pore complex protein Nup214-like [Daktulosphaira vitifoliae]|nr:nuclear pore complex protein Nup214-like [Daktulosphaira vitifoliae]